MTEVELLAVEVAARDAVHNAEEWLCCAARASAVGGLESGRASTVFEDGRGSAESRGRDARTVLALVALVRELREALGKAAVHDVASGWEFETTPTCAGCGGEPGRKHTAPKATFGEIEHLKKCPLVRLLGTGPTA